MTPTRLQDLSTQTIPDSISDSPCASIRVFIYANEWNKIHGRRIKVSELPRWAEIELGKKVFEFIEYAHKRFPDMTDESVYCGCLDTHEVDRDRPDGIDFITCDKLHEELISSFAKKIALRM